MMELLEYSRIALDELIDGEPALASPLGFDLQSNIKPKSG
jgi:hypothetical protein